MSLSFNVTRFCDADNEEEGRFYLIITIFFNSNAEDLPSVQGVALHSLQQRAAVQYNNISSS